MTLSLIEYIQRTCKLKSLKELDDAAIAGLLEQREMGFFFPSTLECIERCYEICDRFFQRAGFEELAAQKLAIAAREAIHNAQRHGNEWQEDRLICVYFMQDDEKVILSVADEGQGFDYLQHVETRLQKAAVDAARERYRAGGFGGLGIKMMLECCDRVLYDHHGGAYLIKYKREAPQEDLQLINRIQSDPRELLKSAAAAPPENHGPSEAAPA